MTKALFIGFFITILSCNISYARNIKSYIRPVIGKNGKLTLCVAEQRYAKNLYLSIGVNKKGKLYISTTIPKANFKPNSKYDINLILDNNYKRKVRAIANSRDTLLIDMGNRRNFRQALISSTILKLGANGNIISYELPHMMQVLTALKKCVNTETDNNKNTSSTFPKALMNLLLNAGFKNVKPLSMEDIPKEKRPADFIWETNNILAGIKSVIAPKNMSLTKLIGLHIKGLREKCTDKFSAKIGRKEKTKGKIIRRASATCAPYDKKKGNPISVALLFTLSNNNRFTVFTHEAEIGKQNQALKYRDQLANYLLKI